MHFHKNLVFTILASVCLSIPAFLAFINKSNPGDGPIIAIFGWMVWLTLFSILAPLFVKQEFTKDWFSTRYVWGTIILAILHVVLVIMVSYYAALILHKW